jgi:hypothetical protein
MKRKCYAQVVVFFKHQNLYIDWKKVQMILYSQFKINYHKKLEERKSPTTKR